MKKLLLLTVLFTNYHLHAQKLDSVGFLSNLKGKGVCIKKSGIEETLKIPYYFLNGDLVKILNGNAIIVLYNEEEIKLASGESYNLTFKSNTKSGNKDLLMFRNSSQLNSSFNMRGGLNQKNLAFPKRSKIINQENAIIRINKKPDEKLNYNFILRDTKTSNIVANLINAQSEFINLSKAELLANNKYFWRLKFAESEMTGELVLLTSEQKEKIGAFELNNRASFVNAYNYYCSVECFFEAAKVLDEAIKIYPDDDFFKYLKDCQF